MRIVEVVTDIRADPECCFDAARDMGLHRRSLKASRERIVAGRDSGLICMDESVTFQARHFGITQRFEARVTAFDRPRHFQDRMVRGVFRSFVHDHLFEPTPSGTTRMIDRVAFAAPCGLVGRAAEHWFLASYLRRLLTRRAEAIRVHVEAL